LTWDFWPENAKKNLQRQEEQQIPAGDDKKNNGKSKGSDLCLVDGLHPTLRDETAKDGAPEQISRG
jgi:hypothetical protein